MIVCKKNYGESYGYNEEVDVVSICLFINFKFVDESYWICYDFSDEVGCID